MAGHERLAGKLGRVTTNQPDLWPNPTDGPVARARKVAHMYRAYLRAQNRTLCDQADQVAVGFGQDWVVESEVQVEPGQALTTAEAAELVKVHPDTVRKWACMEHPERPGERLLPRFKRRGRERTYLAEHVLAAAAAVRRARLARART